ncbi:MAG: tetratricopeptide repeat protein [Verrucomicrobiales bacterium]|nr:tetratricopeptide repeat protein [Verrucomicrobiales bacterium]
MRENFERGMAAYQKGNLDYAVTLFTDVLQKEPAFYECREALRAAQFRRPAATGGLFKKWLGQASPHLAKAQLALRSHPEEALHYTELALGNDPRSTAAHDLLARAAMASDLPRTAVLSLEILFKASPADRDVAFRLGQALVAAGQSDRADRIFADLLTANPADAEVARAYKDLGARRTLGTKGYSALASGEGNYRDALRDKDEAVVLEQETRQVQSSDVARQLIAEYQARLEREPGNVRLLRSLAELHADQKDFDRALAVYEQLIQTHARGDASLERARAQTRVRQFNHQIEQLDPADPTTPGTRAKLERERDELELRECLARAERYPSDLSIRFELGQLHFRAGRLPEAIQELQKAQNYPHRRIAALSLLAQCFSQRGMNDLASRMLQNALKEKLVFDDEKKNLIYDLGCVLEKMGRRDEAIDQFKLIYETDIGFRDVAAKVDAYYAGKLS